MLGFAGSLHCVGMCGPIAVVLPQTGNPYFSRILYHGGRVISYAFIGLLIGLIGEGVSFAGYQQALSIIIGAVIIFSVLFFSGKVLNPPLFKPAKHIYRQVKSGLSKFLLQKKPSRLLMVGILNGFLPCGLVYIAAAGALASANLSNGILYMIIFGLGTIPALLFVSITRHYLGFRFKFQRIIPVFVFLLGILLVLRGLNLDIPYVSPGMEGHMGH